MTLAERGGGVADVRDLGKINTGVEKVRKPAIAVHNNSSYIISSI